MKAARLILLIPAILADMLQAGIQAGIMAVGANISTIGGAAGGAALCSPAGATVAAGCAAVGGFLGSFLTPAAGTAGIVIATVLGYVIGLCLTLAFGGFILILLLLTGMFYFRTAGLAFFFEALPLLNIGPGLTAWVARSIYTKFQEDRSLAGQDQTYEAQSA